MFVLRCRAVVDGQQWYAQHAIDGRLWDQVRDRWSYLSLSVEMVQETMLRDTPALVQDLEWDCGIVALFAQGAP